MSSLNLKIEKEIAILEFEQPGSKVNVLNAETMRELAGIIERLARGAEPGVKALVITSKKDGIFIAGADIKEIECIGSAEGAKEKAEYGKQVFNALHNLGLITIAVINGACLGGGLELALACKYRVAGFGKKVKIGLPEVGLGLLPGWGGTQRLPGLIGLTRALNMLLSGRIISGKEALKYSLVDRLFSDTKLIDEALGFVRGVLEQKERISPVKKSSISNRTGKKKKKKLFQKFLEDTPPGRALLFNRAKKSVLKRTKGFYPAPLKIIEVLKCTYGKDIQKSFLIESEAFGELAITDVSKNLIKVFYLNEEYKKLSWVDAEIKPTPVNKCGVVGAGVMGGGIAQLLTYRDIPVRLKDVNHEALKKALKTAKGIFDYALKKKKLKKHQVDYKLGLISPTLTYKGFENADIVIEAVVEDTNIKQKVLKELSRIASPGTIFASNTSSLPIIKLAEVTDFADRVVGLHFFNPVHRMPLVEIIKSSQTSDQTLATVIAFARRLGKIVIVVGDVTGFLINRILLSYINQAAFLLEEGIKIERIDRIARRFGMPVGPLELADEVGIDVGHKVAKILENAYGGRMHVASILAQVKQKELFGKKTKQGFYLHKGKRKIPNPAVYKLIKLSSRSSISDDVILKRMIYIMVNEAARCLEEKVADRPHTVDIGMIMGTGFPLFRAGLLRYADSIGADNIARDLRNFQKEVGAERFTPCNYLRDMAEKKKKFYSSQGGSL